MPRHNIAPHRSQEYITPHPSNTQIPHYRVVVSEEASNEDAILLNIELLAAAITVFLFSAL